MEMEDNMIKHVQLAPNVPHPHINIDVNYHAPPPDPELVKKHQFMLIRHGVTNFNIVFGDIVGKHGFNSEEFRELKADPSFIDIELRPEGVVQCEKA